MSAVEHANPWLAADLRDAVKQRLVVAELLRARDEAFRANLAKSRFLATASHELAQPLQSLFLLNGTLRRMVSEPDATDVLVQQERAIGALARLLNALLETSRLESETFKSGALHSDQESERRL